MTAAWRPYLPVWLFVLAVKAAIYGLADGRYGYMSDELYFLDAAAHPAWGYVDFPPLLPWLLGTLELHSLLALRGLAALIGAGTTLLAVDLCRELGGRPVYAWLVALVLLFAPGFLSVQSILTMNVLDQFWWLAAFWCVARHARTRAPVDMLALGAVLGLGVLTKLSILALCAALPLAWLCWDRVVFRVWSTWAAAGLALLLFAPFVVWQIVNDWPFLDFVAAYNQSPPVALVLKYPLLGMLLTMNPVYALIWAPGAVYALFTADVRLRVLGTAGWLCLLLFMVAGVKFYFAVPVFGLFIVAGALFWQRCLTGRAVAWRVVLLGVGLSGVAAVPGAAPVLPEAQLQQLARFLRDGEQGDPGRGRADLERYFPHFAEMHGWPALVDLTADAWEALRPEQRAGAVLMAAHYGQAGALNQLDDADRLPEARGRHMSYHLWNRGVSLDHGLFVGFEAAELEALYASVQEVGRLACRGCMARERGLRLYYVAQPRLSDAEIRARLRRYDFF